MNNEFVPYEIASVLNKLGFDEETYFVYYDIHDSGDIGFYARNSFYRNFHLMTPAPLYQQAFRWFREKYNLFILMQVGQHNGEHQTFYFNVFKYGVNLYKSKHRSATGTYTYEEAEHEALRKLIEEVQL